MDDNVIDLTQYLRREPESAAEGRGFFSVWGGEGDRSRFALPLWRSVYLVGGRRAALLSVGRREFPVARPVFVLDLGAEPARRDFPPVEGPDHRGDDTELPAVHETQDAVWIYLGANDDRDWYMVLDDRDGVPEPLEGKVREDLMFLAGECAGLLFFRDLATDPDE